MSRFRDRARPPGHRWLPFILAVGVSAAPASAFAQGGVLGSVVGVVVDSTGEPLAGVRLVASSPTQIGGPRTATTDAAGRFRIVALQPGTFEVRAAAPGMKPVIHRQVRVGLNAAAALNIVMEVESAIDEVKIVETAPVVSTTTAKVREVYDDEFVEQLPLESKIQVEAFVGQTAPGVYYNGLRTIRVRGGGSNQNHFLLEGFYMNQQKVTTGSLAALEVQTAGYGAENAAAPAGVVNMVTKSGSNAFEGDVRLFHEDSELFLFTDGVDRKTRTWSTWLNPSLGGPIIRDRLWFYLNAEGRAQVDAREADARSAYTGDPRSRASGNGSASLKLSWQVAPRHKLQSYSSVNRSYLRNQNGTDHEPAAQQMRDNLDQFHGVTWEALLGDSLLFKAQLGWQQLWENEGPQLCLERPLECDNVPQLRQRAPIPVRLQNDDMHEQRRTSTWEAISTLEWYTGGRVLGDHTLQLRTRVFGELFELAQTRPGDHYLEVNGATYERARFSYANDPQIDEEARFGWRIRGSTAVTGTHSLSDTVRVTRFLTVSAGVALTHTDAQGLGDRGRIRNHAFTPHAQVAWDATHDGRTVVRGSFANYVDVDVLRLARFAAGSPVEQECLWNPATEQFDIGCRWLGGASGRTFGLPCGPDGVDAEGRDCREALRLPRTWEYSVGVERELVPGLALATDLVHRLFANPYESRETNRIWNASGTALDPNGGYRNGRPIEVLDLGTPSDARRRYVGLTAALRKREGVLRLSASYTWARLQGNVQDGEGNEFGTIPALDRFLYGDLLSDSRHTIKSAFVYQARPWLSLGLIYRYLSGRPYSRRFRNDVLGYASDLRAPVGVDPGGNINDPGDDRQLRLPDLIDVNLQARATLRPLIRRDVEIYADVINVFAMRTPTNVLEEDGPPFGHAQGRRDPLRVRLGLRLRF